MRKTPYWWLSGAGLVGLLSAFWQITEKLALLKNKQTVLTCNFNDTFNCSNVLNAHQSSALGVPNALIGVIMFTFFLTIGLVLVGGGALARWLALLVQGLALFMLGFTIWFLFESTYRIQSICIFCLFIGTSVLVINAVMMRYNFAKQLKRWTARGVDLFAWSLIWLVAAFAMLLKFA